MQYHDDNLSLVRLFLEEMSWAPEHLNREERSFRSLEKEATEN